MLFFGPLFDFLQGTLQSTFFSLTVDGPLTFIYAFANFALIWLASLGSILEIVAGT